MFNDVTLVGNAVSAPELVYTNTGTAIAKFNLAVNKHYKNAQNQNVDSTVFIEIVTFGKTAENTHKFVTKGMRILVNGELHQDIWVDNNGKKRSKHNIYAAKVVYLQCKGSSSGAPNNSSNTPEPTPAPTQKTSCKEVSLEDIPDEDIPF